MQDNDILKKFVSSSAIQYQRKYALPSDFLNVSKLWGVTFDGERIFPLPIEKEDISYNEWRKQAAGSVSDYYLDETDNYLCLNPPPSSAADTTTINDATGITATDTTITVADTSNFDKKGSVIVNSEVIHYGYKSSTELLLCTRGEEDTTAAAHSDADTVTKRDIGLFYNYEPDELSSDDDETFNGLKQYDNYSLAIIHAVTAMCMGSVPKKLEMSAHQFQAYLHEQHKIKQKVIRNKDRRQVIRLHPGMLQR